MTSPQRLLIVGFPEAFHIGSMLHRAAQSSGITSELCDANLAYQGNWLIKRLNWRLRSHRPIHLSSFSQQVVALCKSYRPDILLVTGMLPPEVVALKAIRAMGIICINYLTDDPWNPNQKSEWFMQALPHYHIVFSPRHANLGDLANVGCRALYLPFGFDSSMHFPDACPHDRASEFDCDVLFYGGADADRVPYIVNLIQAGYAVHLYGGYWNRYTQTRSAYRGMADIQTLRWAVYGAKVTLCLVRRANRDGHVMRSFEAPAMGACILAEDTDEHRTIFGSEWESAAYFRTIDEMVAKAGRLIADQPEREQLAKNASALIAHQANTYAARLSTVINAITSGFEGTGIIHGS